MEHVCQALLADRLCWRVLIPALLSGLLRHSEAPWSPWQQRQQTFYFPASPPGVSALLACHLPFHPRSSAIRVFPPACRLFLRSPGGASANPQPEVALPSCWRWAGHFRRAASRCRAGRQRTARRRVSVPASHSGSPPECRGVCRRSPGGGFSNYHFKFFTTYFHLFITLD